MKEYDMEIFKFQYVFAIPKIVKKSLQNNIATIHLNSTFNLKFCHVERNGYTTLIQFIKSSPELILILSMLYVSQVHVALFDSQYEELSFIRCREKKNSTGDIILIIESLIIVI